MYRDPRANVRFRGGEMGPRFQGLMVAPTVFNDEQMANRLENMRPKHDFKRLEIPVRKAEGEEWKSKVEWRPKNIEMTPRKLGNRAIASLAAARRSLGQQGPYPSLGPDVMAIKSTRRARKRYAPTEAEVEEADKKNEKLSVLLPTALATSPDILHSDGEIKTKFESVDSASYFNPKQAPSPGPKGGERVSEKTETGQSGEYSGEIGKRDVVIDLEESADESPLGSPLPVRFSVSVSSPNHRDTANQSPPSPIVDAELESENVQYAMETPLEQLLESYLEQKSAETPHAPPEPPRPPSEPRPPSGTLSLPLATVSSSPPPEPIISSSSPVTESMEAHEGEPENIFQKNIPAKISAAISPKTPPTGEIRVTLRRPWTTPNEPRQPLGPDYELLLSQIDEMMGNVSERFGALGDYGGVTAGVWVPFCSKVHTINQRWARYHAPFRAPNFVGKIPMLLKNTGFGGGAFVKEPTLVPSQPDFFRQRAVVSAAGRGREKVKTETLKTTHIPYVLFLFSPNDNTLRVVFVATPGAHEELGRLDCTSQFSVECDLDPQRAPPTAALRKAFVASQFSSFVNARKNGWDFPWPTDENLTQIATEQFKKSFYEERHREIGESKLPGRNYLKTHTPATRTGDALSGFMLRMRDRISVVERVAALRSAFKTTDGTSVILDQLLAAAFDFGVDAREEFAPEGVDVVLFEMMNDKKTFEDIFHGENPTKSLKSAPIVSDKLDEKMDEISEETNMDPVKKWLLNTDTGTNLEWKDTGALPAIGYQNEFGEVLSRVAVSAVGTNIPNFRGNQDDIYKRMPPARVIKTPRPNFVQRENSGVVTFAKSRSLHPTPRDYFPGGRAVSEKNKKFITNKEGEMGINILRTGNLKNKNENATESGERVAIGIAETSPQLVGQGIYHSVLTHPASFVFPITPPTDPNTHPNLGPYFRPGRRLVSTSATRPSLHQFSADFPPQENEISPPKITPRPQTHERHMRIVNESVSAHFTLFESAESRQRSQLQNMNLKKIEKLKNKGPTKKTSGLEGWAPPSYSEKLLDFPVEATSLSPPPNIKTKSKAKER